MCQHLHYKRWTQLENDNFESIWITLFPKTLPRQVANITIAGIYHPPNSNHTELKDHICICVDSITQKHPNTGWMIAGDFNQFPDRYIYATLSIKQIVDKPTQNKSTLDKVYTTLKQYYHTAEILPHIGSSDHNAILCKPLDNPPTNKGRNVRNLTRIYGKK